VVDGNSRADESLAPEDVRRNSFRIHSSYVSSKQPYVGSISVLKVCRRIHQRLRGFRFNCFSVVTSRLCNLTIFLFLFQAKIKQDLSHKTSTYLYMHPQDNLRTLTGVWLEGGLLPCISRRSGKMSLDPFQ